MDMTDSEIAYNGTTLTEYLIDQQPSLAAILRQKIGSQNTHYVHGLRGIASQHDGAGWSDAIADGLGSVRGWLNGSQNFVSDVNYNPYGVPDASVDGFGFTGEMTDDNGLVYLRARYYDPNVGVFASLDPFEGMICSPMSFNGYSWVEGNVANWTDPSGLSYSLSVALNGSQCNKNTVLVERDCSCCGTPTETYMCQELIHTGFNICPCHTTTEPPLIETVIYQSSNLPEWFLDDYNLLCDKDGGLCSLLKNADAQQKLRHGIPRDCHSFIEPMCHLLCNREYEQILLRDDYSHYGILVRWLQYFKNEQGFPEGSEDRRQHAHAYEKVQEQYDEIMRQWKVSMCEHGGLSSRQFEDFKRLANNWRGKGLQRAESSILIPQIPLAQPSPNWGEVFFTGLVSVVVVGGLFFLTPGIPDELVPLIGLSG